MTQSKPPERLRPNSAWCSVSAAREVRPMSSSVDPETQRIFDGLQSGRLTRRQFARRLAGLGFASGTIATFLAACGPSAPAAPAAAPTSAPVAAATVAPTALPAVRPTVPVPAAATSAPAAAAATPAGDPGVRGSESQTRRHTPHRLWRHHLELRSAAGREHQRPVPYLQHPGAPQSRGRPEDDRARRRREFRRGAGRTGVHVHAAQRRPVPRWNTADRRRRRRHVQPHDFPAAGRGESGQGPLLRR